MVAKRRASNGLPFSNRRGSTAQSDTHGNPTAHLNAKGPCSASLYATEMRLTPISSEMRVRLVTILAKWFAICMGIVRIDLLPKIQVVAKKNGKVQG